MGIITKLLEGSCHEPISISCQSVSVEVSVNVSVNIQ